MARGNTTAVFWYAILRIVIFILSVIVSVDVPVEQLVHSVRDVPVPVAPQPVIQQPIYQQPVIQQPVIQQPVATYGALPTATYGAGLPAVGGSVSFGGYGAGFGGYGGV